MPSNPTPTAEHRRAAAEAVHPGKYADRLAIFPLRNLLCEWVDVGEVAMLPHQATEIALWRRTAQAIANEGARRDAEIAYLRARVSECINELRATGGDQNVLGWLERALTESEKARTSG